ncbi:hypothetical protein ES703_80894 [subsurface metagenome]
MPPLKPMLTSLLYWHSARHEDTGADEISVAGLAGLLADDQHVIDAEVLDITLAYLLLAGGTMTGNIAMGGNKVTGLGAPAAQDDSLRYDRAEIRNNEIAAAAAIAYSKLNLTGALKKGDIEAAAGIEYSKLALDTSLLVSDIAAAEFNAANKLVKLDVSALLPQAQLPAHGAAKHTDVTRELWLPANEAFVSAGTPSSDSHYGLVVGEANLDEPILYWSFKVPADFVSFTKAEVAWSVAAITKNMFCQLAANYGSEGEPVNEHSDSPAGGVIACAGVANTLMVQEPANPLTFANLAVDDYIGLRFYRQGSNASDTLDTESRIRGVLFTYVASQ